MKNILIIGVGRAGKTTLSNMIKQKYNSYNLVHSDSIKWAIIRAQDKEDYYEENVEEQKKFEHSEFFQKTLLHFFTSSLRNDKNKFGYILESGQLEPKYVKEMIDFNNTIVVCIGHGDLTKEDIINLCRENDTENDWTYEVADESLEKHVDVWIGMNNLLKEECPKYEIKYIDTSKNRIETLNKILDDISREIEK